MTGISEYCALRLFIICNGWTDRCMNYAKISVLMWGMDKICDNFCRTIQHAIPFPRLIGNLQHELIIFREILFEFHGQESDRGWGTDYACIHQLTLEFRRHVDFFGGSQLSFGRLCAGSDGY